MTLYTATLNIFLLDAKNIGNLLENLMREKFHKKVSEAEKSSWTKSLLYISEILLKADLDSNITVGIEYNLPMTSKRIDFMLFGYDKKGRETIMLLELKQWELSGEVEDSNVLLETYIGRGMNRVLHPAYQLFCYQELLKDFNKNIQSKKVNIYSCAVLHNYVLKKDDPLFAEKFREYLDEVKVFTKSDEKKLIKFIKGKLFKGDDSKIIKEIEESDLYPSKKLQNNIKSLILNSKSLRLIDEQLIIFESIREMIKNLEKKVVIVEGGPGTGKSLIAINLLAKFISEGKLCHYISRNTAPRVVYSYNLKGTMNKSSIDNLFKSSGAFTEIKENTFDVLIVDEAHCLTQKSGLFNNYGDNQIKEIINSSKISIFFIDEQQRVHLNDIGTKKEIESWAKKLKSEIIEFKLESQFRCNGSDDYLRLVDYILGIENDYLDGNINYDLRLLDSPNELERLIKEKNEQGSARILAGYCWDWNKKEVENPKYHDIKINDYSISWNLGLNQTFAIEDSISQAGCIHSVQGLEFDYVGVIIGPDMVFREGKIITDFLKHASTDPSFKGIKKMYKDDKEVALKLADQLIKNAYRVLLTRGIKGCYIYCVDKQLNEHIKTKIKSLL